MGALPRKQETLASLQKDLEAATVAYVVDYRGLTVSNLKEIRRELLKNNAKLTVAKNTLVRRAIENTAMSAMGPYLKGPTALALGMGDQVAPIKIIKEYFKKNKKENEVRGGALDGKPLSAQEVEALTKLPPLEELRAKLVGGIAYPTTGLVAALSGPQRALVQVLDQYAKQKQG